MRIIDESGIEVESPDLEKGYLKNDSLLIMHHEAVEGVKEEFHYETIAEYPNGGKDVKKVVDVPGVEAKEAWDEYEDVLRYVAYTEAELKIREYEKNRNPLTAMEVLEMLLPKQINTLEVDDNTALRMKSYYPDFGSIVGQEVKKGFRFRHGGYLWATVKALTIEAHYPPGAGMESLYTEVNETHVGAVDDPIPYDGNMVLNNGLYYYQNGSIYLCNRDSINPVYHSLAELVGLYVECV